MDNIIILGIISSILAEVVSWVNKKLAGTPLKGDGAFVVAGLSAFIAATVKVAMTQGAHIGNFNDIILYFTQVFTVSQVFFFFIVQKFGMDVQTPQAGIPVNSVADPSYPTPPASGNQ